MRIEPGLDEHHLVQVSRLLHPAERCRFLDRRGGQQSSVGQMGQRVPRRGEMGRAVAEIAPQRHEHPFGLAPGHTPTAK